MSKRAQGRVAEDLACSYLQAAGLRLLRRNYYCRRGEIDLVMQEADTLVFVEVRYRANSHFGSAAESVDTRKQSRLTACARQYLQYEHASGRVNCRFDVLAISGQEQTVNWIRNAFMASDE